MGIAPSSSAKRELWGTFFGPYIFLSDGCHDIRANKCRNHAGKFQCPFIVERGREQMHSGGGWPVFTKRPIAALILSILNFPSNEQLELTN